MKKFWGLEAQEAILALPLPVGEMTTLRELHIIKLKEPQLIVKIIKPIVSLSTNPDP
jgi:hypothetical protein